MLRQRPITSLNERRILVVDLDERQGSYKGIRDMSNVWAKLRGEFNLSASLTKEDGALRWECTEAAGTRPSVYVIVLRPGTDRECETVLYVGMAGKGLATRSKQHNAGLKRVYLKLEGGTAWVHQYTEREEWLAEGRSIEVYERASQEIECFGVNASIQHAEERTLINLLKPRDNRA
jgi:hypothetical protein